ncbi:excisionase family DNA-binding protein [Actinoplanes sp. RD1]|uniref:excisionase family DNA-binding protein n=1 Tax=Actinoplanes sp. RD1 TaxID=3064538 RepID=UPI0027404C27|nr:excisionase family DNA-binding protein [Actinoplanes sp. RD1]
MRAIDTSRVSAEQFDQLERAAAEISPEMLDVIHALIESIRAGAEITVFEPAATLTPKEVADRLGMSRAHLYKLLDRGEIAFDRVGRDRRVPFTEVVEFEQRRQRDRRELAERFAQQQQGRAAAIDELSDLL